MVGQTGDSKPGRDQAVPESSKISRESSPARSARSVSSIPQPIVSRKSSSEFSPTRYGGFNGSLSTLPSAAAVQRALSTNRPILTPTGVEIPSDTPRSDRTNRSGHSSPSWPTSPRLKSPPPSSVSRISSSKKGDGETTTIPTIKKLATVSNPDFGAAMHLPDGQKDQQTNQYGLRVPTRSNGGSGSGLETVAESSVPTTPSIGPVLSPRMDSSIEVSKLDGNSDARSETSTVDNGDGVVLEQPTKPAIDKPETATKRPPTLTPNYAAGASTLTRRSLSSLTSSKGKQTNDPPRTMTIETETVTSNPQLLGGERGTSGRDGTGSVRTKPSNETIRPKKEKKRPARKTPTLQAGTITSKADIFEAKVANAVDEADSSDSDETFVYESNPPDARPYRHHSRTPSATSQASQELHGGRNRHGVRSGNHAVAGKKSMKFSSGAHHNNYDGEGSTDGRGSVRTTSATPRHHHIGRHGRPGHLSILDTDSPFTQANRPNSPRGSVANSARNSRPSSPRVSSNRFPNSPRKSDGAAYDAYEGAADDERTQLLGSVRVNRQRHSRRPNSSGLRRSEFFDDEEEESPRPWLRFGGCTILILVIAILCAGITMLIMALNQPLVDISIKHIQNVLVSEQELMLDLQVEAVNPNLFAISISDLDVNIFAESAYAGTNRQWRINDKRLLRWSTRRTINAEPSTGDPPWFIPRPKPNDNVDEGTDPIDDPESGFKKMLLGTVLHFDSPLTFEASPIWRARTISVGEIRLAKPGNKTEVDGSVRWERVLQHPFDLIIRGVVKFQPPLSSRQRSAKINGRVKVSPDDPSPS